MLKTEHRIIVLCAMQAEKEVLLNTEGPIDEGQISNQNSNPNIASSASISVSQFPAKKPTRQWAAWTHQEEECFFTALRQVGKNFEKITSRVQSKNKDQVRHYYYRLVRRMNKLLGPELSLDAKNPKDTNAAMLRWWSLLEKYSCKASKLHLKPRRFKLFLEALEHQLLKDRRKSTRKRACQGETFSSASLGNISSHSRERGLDNRPFKLILCDSQNVKKLGPGRASTRQGESLGVSLGDEKEDTALGRAGRQRRKQGFRKWEKAAIDGVSLVADAAEHLERTSIDKDMDGQKDLGPARYLTGKSPLSLSSSAEVPISDANMQFAAKLKLQLFPIDECTRRSLEVDKHNPHLELTLSNRKKISSVLEHLNRKWGSSSCACGELMLFPYNARKETVTCHQRWTNDSFLSAAEVHSMVGSPSLFRLRYGWFVQDASGSFISQAPTSASLEDNMNVDEENEVNLLLTESGPLSKHSTAEQATSVVCTAGDRPAETRDNYEPASATITPFENLSSGNALSAGEWADSLTNISVGDLLSEAPDDIDRDCVDPPATEGSHYLLRDVPFASDSFDAAIAAHILRHQNKPSGLLPVTTGSSSLWDDEDTRDAFSFQKNRHANSCKMANVASPGGAGRVDGEPSQLVEASGNEGACNLPDQQEDPMEEGPTDPHTMNSPGQTLCGLADVYWPDSLGPLDLDIRSSKYTDDLNLSESLGGLSRLIATSLDAFQNCSLFGFDSKKDKSNMV